MFHSMIQKVRGVTVAGLSRAELEDLVAGAGRVIATTAASRHTRGSACGSAGLEPHQFHAVSYPVSKVWSCSIQ
ncbi:MAG: hypothetical protein KTU85_02260 [Acidimicrobiia bacterium]|nr:hypothetical protein [Acidimicrobiia bacterium]